MFPLSLKLINHLGLIGSTGVPTGSLVPRADTPLSQQHQFQDFSEAGRVADPDIWSRYSSVMKRPVSFDSMLAMWDEMAGWDLMAAALSEIVHETLQTDATSPATLWYECNDAGMEDELNEMASRVKTEDNLPSQVWFTAAMGNHFEKIEYEPDQGVLGLSFAHPMDVRRYWLERNRRCVGFRWNGRPARKDDAFVLPDNKTPIQRVTLNTGQNIDNLYYPWEFMHIRRNGRLRMTEHGEPIFEEAQGIYKKLRLAIDQMVVHRAQVQPDRYVMNIDVKDQPPLEQMKTVNRWKQSLRSKLSFGPGNTEGLSDPNGFSAFYNAMALDTILWMAKPNGFQHTVDKLQGTANVPDVYDIELLTDLFYSIIGMPKSWFGVTKDQGGEAPSGKSLLAQDMRFLRKIKSIRRPIINSYTWLGYFHAVLKKRPIAQLEIRAKMTPIGSLEDQMKLELLQAQAEVLVTLGDIMDKYKLPRQLWVETIFKRYMHLPDDVVNVFTTSLPPEAQSTEESRLSAPSQFKLLKEISERLQQDPDGVAKVRKLKETLYGDEDLLKARERKAVRSFRTVNDVVEAPAFKDYDLIVSSFGKDPFQFRSPEPLPKGQLFSTAPKKEVIQETTANGSGQAAAPAKDPVEMPAKAFAPLSRVDEAQLRIQAGERPTTVQAPSEPGYRRYIG